MASVIHNNPDPTPSIARGARKTAPKPPRAARTPRGKTPGAASGPCYLTLGSGWTHWDPGCPIDQVVILDGYIAHLGLRVKVKDAAAASWSELARIPSWQYYPESVRAHLPCAVRDASAGKWFMALATVSGTGVISVEATGSSKSGALGKPFPLGVNDEVHISVAYFNP